jgi:hypothetical protein
MSKDQKNKGPTYRIIKIKYCPSRAGQPCMVDVEKTYTGDIEPKVISCDVRVNHVYDDKNERFVPRTTFKGEPWDYQEHDFDTPVCSVVGNNGVGEFVAAEFKKMFQEQRAREGW